MESSEKLEAKIEVFRDSLEDWAKLMKIKIESYPEEIHDGLRNGQIQKFEVCTELLWKTVQKYLFVKAGVEANSPKECIKEFFRAGEVSLDQYELLMGAIDDRNRTSHIYRKQLFQQIYENLPKYLEVFKSVLLLLEAG